MKAKRTGGRVLHIVMYLLFGVYLLFVMQIVLFKTIPVTSMFDLDSQLRSINVIPFHTIAGFVTNETMGSMRALANILGNIVIFIPLGLFVSYQGHGKSFRVKAIIILSVSLALEMVQYILALGSSDVDDILLNFAGGMLGIAVYKGMSRMIYSRQRLLGAIVGFYLLSGIGGIVGIGLVQPELLPFMDTGVEYVTENKPELGGIDVYMKGDLSGRLAAVEENSFTLSTESEAVMVSGKDSSELPEYVIEDQQISINASTRIFFEYVRVEKKGLLKFKVISRYEEKNPGDLGTIMNSPVKETDTMPTARVWLTGSSEPTAMVLLVVVQEE
ncbi:VanZ family protein [Paenibacillus sp. FSL R7-0312]|uniref:VanZ family protein n=1 Tax=Paenibacillus sp. FSL R7-0312 TaxID=2921682 RepID=UPI0030FA511E